MDSLDAGDEQRASRLMARNGLDAREKWNKDCSLVDVLRPSGPNARICGDEPRCACIHKKFVINLMGNITMLIRKREFSDLPIVVLVYYLCYFGWKSMVFDLNVAEMIYFDAVRVNVMQTVMPIHRMQQQPMHNWMLVLSLLLLLLALLLLLMMLPIRIQMMMMLSLSSSLMMLFLANPYHACDLNNPI